MNQPANDDRQPRPGLRRLVLVTGQSGGGMSTALKYLEDMGFYWVDNLPMDLVPNLVDYCASQPERYARLAVGFHFRDRQSVESFQVIHPGLRQRAERCEMLFLEANLDTLVTRYQESRRRHPLASEHPVREAIEMDVAQLAPIRSLADMIIDTTGLAVPALKQRLDDLLQACDGGELVIFLRSFGFKHGTRTDADMVLDARFLPNPYYDPALRPLDGRDAPIQGYLLEQESTRVFLAKLEDLFGYLIPRFREERKRYLTVDIGCTGGRHRSVFVVEELATRLRGQGWSVQIRHLNLENPGLAEGG